MPSKRQLFLAVIYVLCAAALASAQPPLGQAAVSVAAGKGKIIDLPTAGLHALVAEWDRGQAPRAIRYRFTGSNKRYSPWQTWSLDNEAGVAASALLTLPGSSRRIEVSPEGNYGLRVRATSYAPAKATTKARTTSLGVGDCDCAETATVIRDGWCPNGDCPTAGEPTALAPEHLIVHHSAGPTGTTDYELVVRAIYDYHTGTNGWDDIGYHLLIAPDGTVYEGRDRDAQGAHFCGANAATLGICLLGDFTEQAPTRQAVDALTRVGATLACDYGIDAFAQSSHTPSGKTLHGVAGHRDGCNTVCPGEQLYAYLPAIRSAVESRGERDCAPLPAPTGLTVASLSDGDVKVDWDAYASASTLIVERAVAEPRGFVALAELDGTAHRFIDVTAPTGQVFYRVRAVRNGELTPYSNEAGLAVSPSEDRPAQLSLRMARNPVRQSLQINGLLAPVDMAFVSDVSGRTVLELDGSSPRWHLGAGALPRGRYWVMLFSGNEWYTLPFQYEP